MLTLHCIHVHTEHAGLWMLFIGFANKSYTFNPAAGASRLSQSFNFSSPHNTRQDTGTNGEALKVERHLLGLSG